VEKEYKRNTAIKLSWRLIPLVHLKLNNPKVSNCERFFFTISFCLGCLQFISLKETQWSSSQAEV
jgi:hypothetical protein